MGAALQVVYLVFNEGYSAEATGAGLSHEAIRLGRLLTELLPEPEVKGLLGLMLLQESRRSARCSPGGELILLDQQDRSMWNKDQIAEGIALTGSALASRRFGAYTLAGRRGRGSTPKRRRRHPRTGGRLSCFTTGCFGYSDLRWWNSTVLWP